VEFARLDHIGSVVVAKLSSPSTTDQFALELFYRAVVAGFQITPMSSSFNPATSFEPVFDIRIRAHI
jgi:hypothetical protein